MDFHFTLHFRLIVLLMCMSFKMNALSKCVDMFLDATDEYPQECEHTHTQQGHDQQHPLAFCACRFLVKMDHKLFPVADTGQSTFSERPPQSTPVPLQIMLRTKVNPSDKRLFLRRQNVAPMPPHHCNGPADCMMHRELSFAFRVSIYQLLVFWLPGGLIASGLVAYGFHRFRAELLRREFNFRREVVGDLHDNLSSRLYALRILSSQIASPAASEQKQQERTTRLSELALDCMQVISNIIWSFDPNHNSLDTLVAKVKNFTEKAISPLVPVELNIPSTKKMQHKVIRPQTNHLLLMIFQELLTNIIKHTQSVNIRIDIYSKEDQLVVNIQNYFEKPPTTTLTKPQDADEHYGLDNLSSRLLKIKGELDFNQTSNAQYFHLMIPMKA